MNGEEPGQYRFDGGDAAPYQHIMKAAIEVAETHKTPFGAALAMGDQIVVTAANQTQQLHDPTAHAEMMAIRSLGELIQKTDLSGYTLYSTCEPCPMCMSAAIWARLDAIVFGCGISEVSGCMDQISLASKELNEKSFHHIGLTGGYLRKECRKLLLRFH